MLCPVRRAAVDESGRTNARRTEAATYHPRMIRCRQSTSPLSCLSEAIPSCESQSKLVSPSNSIERPTSSTDPVFSLTTLTSDTRAIPAFLSASSALLLLIRSISTREFVKKLFALRDEDFEPPVEQVPHGFVAKLRHHAKRYGGATIFVCRVLRLLAVLDLVGFTVVTIALGNKDATRTTHHAQVLNWSLLGAYVRFPSFSHYGNPHHLTALRVCFGLDCCVDATKNRQDRKHPPRLGVVRHMGCLRL